MANYAADDGFGAEIDMGISQSDQLQVNNPKISKDVIQRTGTHRYEQEDTRDAGEDERIAPGIDRYDQESMKTCGV